jgi:hypothetical protein
MADAAEVARELRLARPHVTLARPRRDAGSRERALARAWADALDLGQPELWLTSLGLYTWSESRASRLFRLADTYPLLARP